MRKKIFNITDVETANTLGHPLVYDIACKFIDKAGNELYSGNWLIREVFTNPQLMTGAYYAEKYYTLYPDILMSGECRLVPWRQFVDEYTTAMQSFGVNVFTAYNATFDIRSIRLTDFWINTGIKSKHMLERRLSTATPEQAELLVNPPFWIDFDSMQTLDIYRTCVDLLMNGHKFRKTALEHMWITPNGNYQTTAEVAWRYLSGNYHFQEAHTAAEDVRIETDLLIHCLKQRKKLRYDTLDPACIIARGSQPLNGKYFHERIGQTYTLFLNEQFEQTFMPWDLYRQLNYHRQWEIILDLPAGTIVPETLTPDDREQLRDKFKAVTGVNWRDWIRLEDNYKKIVMLSLAGADWYMPDDKIADNVQLPPGIASRYSQEKAQLDGKLKNRPKPVTVMPIPQLMSEE